MNNNLTTKLQNEINEYKTDEDNDLLSLLLPTSFDQLFKLVKKVKKLVYENEFINDEK